jgi:hypothetical protein
MWFFAVVSARSSRAPIYQPRGRLRVDQPTPCSAAAYSNGGSPIAMNLASTCRLLSQGMGGKVLWPVVTASFADVVGGHQRFGPWFEWPCSFGDAEGIASTLRHHGQIKFE